ncbi:fimbrial protein [Enterobacter hormaechei]
MEKRHGLSIFLVLTTVMIISSGNVEAGRESAQVTINATVEENSCTIDFDSGIQTISLNDISEGGLKKGTVSGEKSFSIKLNDCGYTSLVSVATTGVPDQDDNTAFANQSTGGATGVGVYVYTSDGIKFMPDGSNAAIIPLRLGDTKTIDFKVAYVATNEIVYGGPFRTTFGMIINYH